MEITPSPLELKLIPATSVILSSTCRKLSSDGTLSLLRVNFLPLVTTWEWPIIHRIIVVPANNQMFIILAKVTGIHVTGIT